MENESKTKVHKVALFVSEVADFFGLLLIFPDIREKTILVI